jgi:shikimate kinase
VIILIVGPSGAGKSETLKRIRELLPTAGCFHLDCEVQTRSNDELQHFRSQRTVDEFTLYGIETIDQLARDNAAEHLVVDVGAGFLNGASARTLHEKHHVIYLDTDPAIGYRRLNGRPGMENFPLAVYQQTVETFRSRLLGKAHRRIDTSAASPESVATQIVEYLNELWAEPELVSASKGLDATARNGRGDGQGA